MAIFERGSLDHLRNKVDLVDLVASYIKLSRSGGYYKACCPFHEEKTPSFVINQGDNHYHCFGCGAHGDAIAFLMGYLKLGFKEAVEHLAEKFNVSLTISEEEGTSSNKKLLREALFKASRFYHFCLLHTEAGHEALSYLYARGIDLGFIEKFQLGFAPEGDVLKPFLKNLNFDEKILIEAGLLHPERRRDFFYNRVMIPIQDALGQVIGFSARKIKEEVFGGKYVNTPETPLFKKSHVLFGLHYSRSRIAKEKKAIIVEGQIDALRLIFEGFDFTVAGQGTAFGEQHVKELLHLGVEKVFLALDGDEAGKSAAMKIGHLFQKKGVDVKIVALGVDSDPDTFIREKGPKGFEEALGTAKSYLEFIYEQLSQGIDLNLPAAKNHLVEEIAKRIRDWEHPVLIYESLKKLCTLAEIPESILGIKPFKGTTTSSFKPASRLSVDGDKILEVDVLRWQLIGLQQEKEALALITANVSAEDFFHPECKQLFVKFQELAATAGLVDLLSLGNILEDPELKILSEITEKRVNRLKITEGLLATLSKFLERKWMLERSKLHEEIKNADEENQLLLSKKLSDLLKNPPRVAHG